jgi:hypothetical protein
MPYVLTRFKLLIHVATAIAMTLGGTGAVVVFTGLFHSFSVNKQPALEDKIKSLSSSLNTAASTISQIETEIAARQTLVQQLKSDAETAEALSALNQQQTQAIAQSLRGQLEKKEKEGFWWSIAQNVFFAALGAAFGELYHFLMRRRRISS